MKIDNGQEVDNKIQKIIEKLKVAKEKKHMSYTDIVRKTEENGEPVSLSTVKNVFGKDPKHNHNYLHTLRPILNAVSPEDVDDIGVELLHDRLDLKDEVIEQEQQIIKELKERIATKDHRHKEREKFLIEQIEFYKEQLKIKDEQIKFRDKQIKRYEDNIDRKDAELKRLYTERE